MGDTASIDSVTAVSAARTRAPELAAGDALADRFVLQQRLGRGGSGVVWSALDTMVGDRVAVKVFDDVVHDPANRERLRREVRATRSGHPNLVSIHELHETDGCLFLTMELVEGSSLRDVLADRRRLALDDVLRIGAGIADALAHLHGLGLVHRDVKPGNVMLGPDGAAKLCDMGLARPLAAGVTVTATEMVVGTPAYMAPEMARGELTAASDVYALGLTLYQALTGTVPLSGTTAVDTFMARQQGRPPRVRKEHPTCPRWLERMLDRMLDPAPGLRPTAAEVAQALRDGRFRWRPHRRHLRAAAAAFAATALGVVGWTWGMSAWRAPPDPAADPTANKLMVDIDRFDSGAVFDISNGYGERVMTLSTAVTWKSERQRLFRNRSIAFGDIDGDGRQDVVFTDPDYQGDRKLQVFFRRADGSTELGASWELATVVDYEGLRFDNFAPEDVECADLDGDGAPEIVVALNSNPYYAAAVKIFRGDGREVLRVLHPGQLANLRTADRDGNGRREIYVAGTNNFHGQNVGNESSPAFFVVEADWGRVGQVVDLFGPGRTMAPTVPRGVRVHYIAMRHQRLVPPLTPWRYAVIRQISATGADRFLTVQTDRMNWLGRDHLSMIRSFAFDRQLELADAMWLIGPLDERGIDPASADPAQMVVSYWNGSTWQPEVCAIPQAE